MERPPGAGQTTVRGWQARRLNLQNIEETKIINLFSLFPKKATKDCRGVQW